MEKEYVFNLGGLTCEHCGMKIKNDTERLNGVKKADINVMAQKMTVISSADEESILNDVKKIVLAYEPDVRVSLNQYKNNEAEEDRKSVV